MIPSHLLDTVPVNNDGIGHSVMEESVLDSGAADRNFLTLFVDAFCSSFRKGNKKRFQCPELN